MRERPRTIKNVSFADNSYEKGLLDFATKPAHGPFSVYIKRLIEQDRAGVVKLTVHATASQGAAPIGGSPTPQPADIVRSQKDRNAAMDLL